MVTESFMFHCECSYTSCKLRVDTAYLLYSFIYSFYWIAVIWVALMEVEFCQTSTLLAYTVTKEALILVKLILWLLLRPSGQTKISMSCSYQWGSCQTFLISSSYKEKKISIQKRKAMYFLSHFKVLYLHIEDIQQKDLKIIPAMILAR